MFRDLDHVNSCVLERGFCMVDLKFIVLACHWHHVTVPAGQFNGELLRDGVGFDASSVGLKPLKAGDMILLPDLGTGFVDPLWEMPTLSVICSAHEADSTRPFPLDPRSIAKRASQYMQELAIADKSRWGSESKWPFSTM
jgi:glutamine synthetase